MVHKQEADLEDAAALGPDAEPLGIQQGQVGLGIQLPDVVARAGIKLVRCLGPPLPLEADILPGAGQAVGVVYWGQLPPLRGLARQDVGTIAVGVHQPQVQDRDLVDLHSSGWAAADASAGCRQPAGLRV